MTLSLTNWARAVEPPLATENLLENTDGVLRPPEGGGGRSTPSVFSRDGSLPPSICADERSIDAVIVSKASAWKASQSW